MALPATPMLDDFSRPDESPLSWGGKWANADTSLVGSIDLVSQRAVGGEDIGFRYWTPLPNLVDSEVYVELRTVGGSTYTLIRAGGVGGAGALDGYVLSINSSTLTLSRLDNAVFAANLGSRAFVRQAGDVVVLRAVGPTITVYVVRAGSVIQALSGSDKTYTSGFIGIGSESSSTAFVNFGGGSLNPIADPRRQPPVLSGYGAI